MRKPAFAFAKTKTQISCAVTAQLISAFVFAIRIVQSLYFLNPKFQASSRLMWLYSLVCVGPGRNPPPKQVFSQRGSHLMNVLEFIGSNEEKRNWLYMRVPACKQNKRFQLCVQRRHGSTWHPPSVIRVFSVRMENEKVLIY